MTHFSDGDISCLEVTDDKWFSDEILILEPFGNSADAVLYHNSSLDFSQIAAVNFDLETGRINFTKEEDESVIDSGLRVFAPASQHLMARDHILLIQLSVTSPDDIVFEKRCLLTEFCSHFVNVFRKPLICSDDFEKVKKIFPKFIKDKLLRTSKAEDSEYVRFVQDILIDEKNVFRLIPPGCVGQLFSPDDFDIYCDREKEITYIFHGTDISRLNISRLEFHTSEFWAAVILDDGRRLDLGASIRWLVRGEWFKAKNIFIIQTKDGETIGGIEVPKVNIS